MSILHDIEHLVSHHPIYTVHVTKDQPFLYCVSWKWMTAENDLLRTLKQVRAAHPYIHLRSPAFGSRPTPYVTAVRYSN